MFQIPKPLQEIISFDNKHTILVYKNGTCESLGNRLANNEANITQIVSDQIHEITNIALFNTLDNHVMLTYFLRHKKSGAIEFVYFLLNDDDLTPNVSAENVPRIKLARKETTLSGFTVVKGEHFPSLMTVCKCCVLTPNYFCKKFHEPKKPILSFPGSDKRVFMLPLRCNENTPTDFGPMVVMFDCLRVDKPLTFVSVSTNCVAIYGGNTKQDGASLVLYNTRHHIVGSTQHFKVHLNNCRLWVIGEFILMAVGQRLSCAPFRISQEKLIDIIGSKRSIEWNGHVNKDCINEESELEENVYLNGKALRNGDVVTNTVKSSRKGPAYNIQKGPEIFQNFENNLESLYCHDIAVEIIEDDAMTDTIKLTGAVHPKDQPSTVEDIARLMEVLVNNGTSEAEITEHVIYLLIQAKLTAGLHKFLRKITNISERMLADSLKYFVNLDESEEKLACINQVFACSFDTTLIKEHLRTNLKLDNAIYLLELIHKQLNDDEFLLEESPQFGHHFDSDNTLINWFVVILESHYQQFLLVRDPNVNGLIVKWRESIETFVGSIRELKPVQAKIASLVNGKWIQSASTSSKCYSVERVQLYKK